MTREKERLDQLSSLREELMDLREVREQGAGTVELDQTRTGRLSRVDALQRQAIAQHGRRLADATMRRIDAAIRRIDDGRYGLCLECDEQIAEARLDVDPAAELCIRCAQHRDAD